MKRDANIVIDATFIRRKVAQMQARESHSPTCSHERSKALSDIVRLIDKAEKRRDYTGVCEGCIWKGVRYQKCSCCVRNANIKDCYKEVEANGQKYED